MKKTKNIVMIFVLICLLAVFTTLVVLESISIAEHNVITEVATNSQNKQIQQKLKELGYYNGSIDGVYGTGTKNAVKSFQKDKGLVADGIVGVKTANALGINLTAQSSSDVYLLAKCIHAEARGEPYVGQVAVGAVILNRVADSRFPNTLSGVIYQPWAFTAVNDGQINLEPNATAYQAANDALNGWDPTYGCVYYYNPATATSKWIFSTKKVLTIGKHVFAV